MESIFNVSTSLFWQILFLLTGIITTMGYQFVYYSGSAEPTTLLPIAANYLGAALIYFVPMENQGLIETNSYTLNQVSSSSMKKIVSLSILEFFGGILSVLGIVFAGSGIYQVVYSSIVIFTALWSRIFLQKNIKHQQWVAIFMVTAGLAFSALGSAKSTSETNSASGNTSATESMHGLMGVVFTMMSTLFYSFHYVISERLITSPDSPPSKVVSYLTGSLAFTMAFMYLIIYTFPNWNNLVLENVEKKNGNWSFIFLVYLLLVLSNLLHTWAFFQLMNNVGAVSTGILQSLRAVSVFFISSFFYCNTHPEQCLNVYKTIATVIVVSGVLYFSIHAKSPPQEPDLSKVKE